MQKSSTKTLYDYWNMLRGSRSAPDRRDIDPTRIRNALANTFILELNDEREFWSCPNWSRKLAAMCTASRRPRSAVMTPGSKNIGCRPSDC